MLLQGKNKTDVLEKTVQKEILDGIPQAEPEKTADLRPLGQKEQSVSGADLGIEEKESTPKLERKSEDEIKTESSEGQGQEGIPKATAVSPIQTAPADESKKIQVWVKKLKSQTKEEQVKTLNELAMKQGVDFAVSVVRALDDAHVLDELHDNLVGELYQKLVEQGKLKSF